MRSCIFWETKYCVLSMHFKNTRANKTGFFIFYAGLNLYMLVITQNNVSIQVSFKIRLILNGSRLLSKLDYKKNHIFSRKSDWGGERNCTVEPLSLTKIKLVDWFYQHLEDGVICDGAQTITFKNRSFFLI